MFQALARFVVKLPWLVVALWIVGAVLLLKFAPSYSAVAAHQQSSNLPASAESMRAAALAQHAFPQISDNEVGTLVIADSAGVGLPDLALAQRLATWLRDPITGPGHVQAVQSPSDSPRFAAHLLSQDHLAYLMVVTFDTANGNLLGGTVAAIEQHVQALALAPQQRVGFTSDAAITHDLGSSVGVSTSQSGASSSSSSSPTRSLGLLVVLVVLALVYRSPLAVLLPLLAIGAVLLVGPSVIAWVAMFTGLAIGSFSLPFVVTVTLGAGTNYGLFLISRYREELRAGAERQQALETAIAQVGAAITSSAATVVLAMSLMGLAKLELFRSLGPAVAISIVLMLLSGLTLMPALVAIAGNAFFWPTHPARATPPAHPTFWTRVGQLVVRQPALVAGISLVVLIPLALTALTVRPSFDLLESLPQSAPAVNGFNLYKTHFANQLATLTIYLDAPGTDLRAAASQGALSQITQAISGPHVGLVRTPTQPNGAGTPATSQDAQAYFSADGHVARFNVLLDADPTSPTANQVVNQVEARMRVSVGASALHGATILAAGQPAQIRDQAAQLNQDFTLVAGLVSLTILIVLIVLLRSFTAPFYLLATVALSTATAVGLTAVIYQQILHLPIFYTTPLFGFVFLIALGEDFNIFMMSRLREETQRSGQRAGTVQAISHTGGVVSSCGLVMAATFFLLVRLPLVVAQQIGVVVVIGVLLDTFIVRPILVPAIATLLDKWNRVWFTHKDASVPVDVVAQ